VLRVLHVSDVHVDVPLWRMPLRGFLGKRLIGGANLVLRRHRHFAVAREKLAQLAQFADEQSVDVVVCTGDYTALGTWPELIAARAAIEPLVAGRRGFVTVPGNHDVYVPDAIADGRFHRVFGDLLGTDWPEHAVAGGWPRVRLYDDCLAVVSVDSARPNPQPWRSSGRIPDVQLKALRAVMGDARLDGRTVLIATHYAPRRPDGTPDRYSHGLENADELLAVCAARPQTAILHGHIHWRFHLAGVPHLFGSGSTTHEGREGLWLFDVEPSRCTARPGAYRDGRYVLEGQDSVVL
jgi:3',5'-cyclic AMP phosphodiesterase CpdA